MGLEKALQSEGRCHRSATPNELREPNSRKEKKMDYGSKDQKEPLETQARAP